MKRVIKNITADDLKFGVEVNMCNDDTKVTFEFDSDVIEEIITEKSGTIPGHPNCQYGDCYDCHVVSCGIYQGYEEIPRKKEYLCLVLKVKDE